MSYCVKCGVKLSPGSKSCPLCGTAVISPEEQETAVPTFPRNPKSPPGQRIRRSTVALLLELLLILPPAVCLICDFVPDRSLGWSYIVLASILLAGVFILPPVWKGKKFRPFYFFLDFSAVGGFLAFLCAFTGGNWFWESSLQVLLLAAAEVYIAWVVRIKTKISALRFAALVLTEIGFFCLGLEILLNRVYHFHSMPVWSLYPLVALSAIGVILTVIDRDPALKEKLARKFFT